MKPEEIKAVVDGQLRTITINYQIEVKKSKVFVAFDSMWIGILTMIQDRLKGEYKIMGLTTLRRYPERVVLWIDTK